MSHSPLIFIADRPTWLLVGLFGVAYALLLPALSAVGLEGDSLYEAPSCITGSVHGFDCIVSSISIVSRPNAQASDDILPLRRTKGPLD